MERKNQVRELFCTRNYHSLAMLSDNLNVFIQESLINFSNTSKIIVLDLIDRLYFNEVKEMSALVDIYFGKTLKELKCVIIDEEGLREHDIFIKYSGPNKYTITNLNLPYLPYQDEVYGSINEIIHKFRDHVNSLKNYFAELERIDRFCSVMEPLYPTYRDDYRKILIDDRTWLHVEVTPDGGATNINLIGQSEPWHDKLHTGLLNWDHDKDIVENIMSIFDLSGFPSEFPEVALKPDSDVIEKQICGICLSNELPDTPGVPQPLCQNNSCGVYFHRSCLYEWLIANAGGRPPAFGVATGTCPTCLHPIACSENNDR